MGEATTPPNQPLEPNKPSTSPSKKPDSPVKDDL